MTRILIDTDELHDIARDLRHTTGDLGDLLGRLGSGFHGTWMPLGAVMVARWEGQDAQLRVLAERVTVDAASLDIEAMARDAEETVDNCVGDLMGGVRWSLRELETGTSWAKRRVPALLERLGRHVVAVVVTGVLSVVAALTTLCIGPLEPVFHRIVRHDKHPKKITDVTGDWKGPTSLSGAHSYAQYMRIIGAMPPGTVVVLKVSDGPPARWVVLIRGVAFDNPGKSFNSPADASKSETTGWNAYEDAVWAAMAKAGVKPGDSLMLMGHSQGGITARNLAADSEFVHTYKVDGVVTGGSPVREGYPLADSRTKGVSLYDLGDPVTTPNTRLPVADLGNRGHVEPVNFDINTAQGAKELNPFEAHGNANYVEELNRLQYGGSSPAGDILNDATMKQYLQPVADGVVHVVNVTRP